MTEKTYNIKVKCKTEEERDLVLQHLERAILPDGCDDLIEQAIVRFRGEPNVYFSTNNEDYWYEQPTVIT